MKDKIKISEKQYFKIVKHAFSPNDIIDIFLKEKLEDIKIDDNTLKKILASIFVNNIKTTFEIESCKDVIESQHKIINHLSSIVIKKSVAEIEGANDDSAN